jgi:hypothetical protein
MRCLFRNNCPCRSSSLPLIRRIARPYLIIENLDDLLVNLVFLGMRELLIDPLKGRLNINLHELCLMEMF